MKPILLILLLTVSVYAQKIKEGKAIADWIPVSTGTATDPVVEGDGKMLMSFAKVQRSGDTFKGWARFVLPTSSINVEGKWREIRFYMVCDCKKNQVRVLTGIAYGLDGTVRAEESKSILEHTERGTTGWDLFEYFCERGGPALVAPTLKPK